MARDLSLPTEFLTNFLLAPYLNHSSLTTYAEILAVSIPATWNQ